MSANFNAEQSHASLSGKMESELSHIRDALRRIEEQTTRTNGRVTRLERINIMLLTALIVLISVKWPELLVLFGFIG